MAEIYKEHREELGSIYVPKTIAQILMDVSMINDFPRKVMILEFHIQALEEELRRSSASKHPLYYSVHFLEDAIEILEQEILRCKRRGKNPVMPVKSGLEECSSAKESKNINEKREWMSSVQLCTTPLRYHNDSDTNNQDSLMHHKSSYEGYEASSSGRNFNHIVGKSMPFQSATMDNRGIDLVSSSAVESEVAANDLNVKRKDPQMRKLCPQPHQKKQRRFWSPELHKKFVEALQQLGGVGSATPKQIREVMNVKGLTNDEVKSHLQKHRICIRKLPSPARKMSDNSWPTQDTRRDGALMPVVAYPRTSQIHNLHLVGGRVGRGSSDTGSSMDIEEGDKCQGHGLKVGHKDVHGRHP